MVKITKINYFSLNVFTKIHGIESVDLHKLIVSITGPESAIGFVSRMRFKQSVVLQPKNTGFDRFLLHVTENKC